LERLGEIHNRDDEEKDADTKITIFPEDKSIYIHELSFKYNPLLPEVLQYSGVGKGAGCGTRNA